ncbi:MAG TPA: GNAT family protein [Rhodanobacter sp.]|nr:GNAT family protein [Rhodanobacter sp.]
MSVFTPSTLRDDYVTLEPLRREHASALERAAADGELWQLAVTSVPAPGHALTYIEKALQGQAAGTMLPFAVREAGTGQIVGTTRYYAVEPDLPRLAIGYTWYAKRWQQTHLNTACKRLLLEHAFTRFGCVAVAFHTDLLNTTSQRAITRLGAQREGVLRAHQRRTDGSIRDTVCFSILASEWPDISRQLGLRLARLARPA